MAYTPSPRQSGSGISYYGSDFGPLRRDPDKAPLNNANALQTIDATGTPVTSPVTVNTTQTLTIPQNAVSVTICSVTNAVQVSEDSTQSAYFSLPAGTPFTFDLADQEYLYLKTGSSTVVSFMFHLV